MLAPVHNPLPQHRINAILLLAVLTGTASASDKIEWRSDYDSARREATEKNKPLFLDFGTEDCLHCKRMHQTTFRDPAIIKLINDGFIPLKVDANREPKLTQALRIQAYPTMIFAGNDGKILGWIEGYMENGRFTEQIQRVSAIQTPDWMAREYQEAAKSKGAGDYAAAVLRLKKIVEDGKDRSIQTKAREDLQEIEMQAAGRLARVKALEESGRTSDALDLLAELASRYNGTQAAADGLRLKLHNQMDDKELRVRRAKQLLADARKDFESERYLNCLDKCEVLEEAYRDLPVGKDAAQLAKEIKGSGEKMVRVCEAMNNRLADMYTALAESFIKQGQFEQATAYLDKVVKLNPTASAAAAAQARLSQIQDKVPAMPTGFPKP
jgi:thioredoxin-related protein